MKDKTKKLSAHGDYTFHGKHQAARDRPNRNSSVPDIESLKQLILERFIGQKITFGKLCDALYPDPVCYYFTELTSGKLL